MACAGLECLHHDCDTPKVDGSVKTSRNSSNTSFLDDSLLAKLGEYGFSDSVVIVSGSTLGYFEISVV